jgi:hypothetical protein
MSDVLEIDAMTLARYRLDPAAFIEECLISPYDNKGYRLNDAERTFLHYAFQFDADDGRLKFPLMLYSAIKKSRKTEFSALFVLTLIILFGGRFAEGFILANDEEQASARCFEACRRIIAASPLLRSIAEIRADRIVFPATQSSIRTLSGDYAGAAGGHPTISVFSELWAYTSTRARRLFDEMIPVPTRKISCRLIETHAGFSGEGELLYELFQRGLQLPQVASDLYAGDGMLMHWSHTPLHHWQDDKWLAQMRRELPANQYLRMVENRFTSSEAAFIIMSRWDQIIRPELGHIATDLFRDVFVGIDASTKRDSTAIVVVSFDRNTQMVRLCTHRIFQPGQSEPLDFELTIEAYVLDLKRRFRVKKVLFDPWQMQSTAQRLQKAGLPIEEFAQSSPNLTAASQNLFELINSQALVAYPDQDMRLAISRAIAIETPRGWRIGKDKQTHKIDVVVALAMACYAAVQAQGESSFDTSWGWVQGTPIGGPPQTDEQRKAADKKLTEDCYRARLHNYLRIHGAFGWP